MRLVDLGVESWIVANSLLAVVAQRLVRVLCDTAPTPHELPNDITTHDEGVTADAKGTELRRAGACAASATRPATAAAPGSSRCSRSTTICASSSRAAPPSAPTTRRSATAGLVPLREAGLARRKAGVTSLEEVLRVT